MVKQTLAGHVHGNQRRGAGGVDVDARSAQMQLVGGAQRDIVLVVAKLKLQSPHCPDQVRSSQQVIEQVGALSGARVYADQSLILCRIISAVLERLPCAFEKDAVLRVSDLG